ncbi:hypothetical protein GI584_01390 [Gracilibacillus salitolerans]|uniref:Uncharacterized protein n=1 Tax=Gracilibacillus salitolerans TaxID=2663022 RepID=A0A5Q2TFA0_9BACI|nr:hypothetical protein [Gracilibacillus salitolerans]QGH32791.1 hypothetical protein GI584_01390 [Gracilibacillus salitolerans]
MDSKNLSKANKTLFGSEWNKETNRNSKNTTEKSFVNITLKADFSNGEGELPVEGNGTIKISNETFPIKFSGNVPVYDHKEQQIINGPVDVTFVKGEKEYSGLMGLYFNPENEESIISLTIGEISSDGTAFLVFGELTDTYKSLNEDILYQQGIKKSMVSIKTLH